MSVNVSETIGLLVAGIISERLVTERPRMVFFFFEFGHCFRFFVFLAPKIRTLLAGELLLGLPWGAYQTLTVSYVSEVCLAASRFYLTTYVNAWWVVSQLIASSILVSKLALRISDSYRIPFALLWLWPIPIAFCIFFASDSPW